MLLWMFKSMTTGLGVIIRDAACEVQVSLACSTIKANLQPVIAEARALRRAMELCADLGFSNVIFEGDSFQEIVKAFNAQQDSWTAVSPFLYDIKRMLQIRVGWKVSFNFREMLLTSSLNSKIYTRGTYMDGRIPYICKLQMWCLKRKIVMTDFIIYEKIMYKGVYTKFID